MLEKQLTGEQIDDLVDGLVRGEYNLLFGAGASIGARAKDTSKLPDADTLAAELLSDFSVETGGYKLDLKSAYEQVEGLKDKVNRTRNEYFSARFSECEPTWQVLLPKLRWNRIWSLNIDDVVESAYDKVDGPKQNSKPIDWTDYYSEPDRKKDELQIVHLHGFAPLLNRAKSTLIFSILEYLQATSKLHAWHRIFGDEFLQRPFIVIGAKLTDEFDLADVIRRGNNSKGFSGRPSFIVLKEIPPFLKENFKKWGLIPIEATGEDFINNVLPRVEARGLESFEFSGGVSKESLQFFNQFRWLKVDDAINIHLNHDFYLGDDPDWADIINDRDAVFDISRKILQDIDQEYTPSKTAKQSIYCICGNPGSGKSTSVLRIARELVKSGHDLFLFKGETRIDIQSVIWCIKTFRKPVFLFDNIADFANDIGALAIEVSKSKLGFLAIATERDQRIQQVYQGILPEFLIADNLNCDRMTDGDIIKLIKKLESNKRLGKITRLSSHERVRYFKRYANRQLLVGMSELEGGKGFPRRIKSEYDSIVDEVLKRIYDLACVTYSLGYQLPLAIACASTGANATDVVNSLKDKGALSGVMTYDGVGLKPRHRVIASLVIEKVLNKADRYGVALLLAKTLSPYITIRTISQKTIPYRIVRRIMDADLIYEWVGSQKAREFYEALVQHYSWNARFWEQRALLESRLGHFPKARSFAEEAVRIQKHSFTLNTLGSILTKMAIEYLSPDSKEAYDLFLDGLKCLKEARTIGDETIHTYATFFNRTLLFAKLAFRDKGELVDEKLKTEWHNWMQHATRSPVYMHTDNKEQLKEIQKRWLLLAVKAKVE